MKFLTIPVDVLEFFDENHGPEPGHPYYHIWFNKFIKKPPPPTPATHSRHSPSSVCGGRKQDSDYRHSRGAVEVGRSSHGMEGGGGARSSDNIRHHNSHHPVINSRRSGGHSYRHEEELIRNLTPPPKSRLIMTDSWQKLDLFEISRPVLNKS